MLISVDFLVLTYGLRILKIDGDSMDHKAKEVPS